jgi:ABC-type multidrug transport system ATPase subunit
MPEPLVEIEHVSKSFGEKLALDDLCLAVPPGQICGLLGPNGAGKTTLFRIIMGILKATQGSLRIDGKDAFDDRVILKRSIGFLPDEPVFYSYLTGRETLELSAAMHGKDPEATVKRLSPLAERLELQDALPLFADDYSRGMKKKLGLLLALLHKPKLLILDEPTNGLDVEGTRLFYELMGEESRLGTTIFFSSHLMDQVTKLCTHAAVLNHGRLVAQGTIEDLVAAHGGQGLEEVFLALTRSSPP